MLRVGHKIGYTRDDALNIRAGYRSWTGTTAAFASAPVGAVVDLFEEDGAVRFEARAFTVPGVAVTHDVDGGAQVFVRCTHKEGEVIAFPTDRGASLLAEVRARVAANRTTRIVLVGADAMFEPRREALPGRLDAIAAFAAVLEGLAGLGPRVVWRTRGGLVGPLPGDLARALLSVGRAMVVEIGLPSLDPRVAAALEGSRSAPPEDRLRLAAALTARNIAVHALLDPMVPMLTDQPEQLKKLFSALVDAGVHRVETRYLVLTRARARALSRRLSKMTRDLLKGIFAEEPWRSADPEASSSSMHEPHKLLPPGLRRLGHHRMVDIGASLGLVVEVLDPATDAEVLSREDRARRREDGRERLRRQRGARAGVPQLDLFGRKAG